MSNEAPHAGEGSPHSLHAAELPACRACAPAAAFRLLLSHAQTHAHTQVGDGDCGSTLALGAAAVRRASTAGRLPWGDAASLSLELGRLCGSAMGGTSGAG